MSVPVIKLTKNKFSKNKGNNNINNNSNNKNEINPGVLNFFKKIQVSKNNQTKNKNYKKQSLSENICGSLINQEFQKNYLEENDKEIKLGAQKGLLYLLHNLSKGSFFPEINDFFDKMKDIKLEELRLESKSKNIINNYSNSNNTFKTTRIEEEQNSESEKIKDIQNKNDTVISQIQNDENKDYENNERKNSKSVTKVGKNIKDKKSYRNKNKVKFNSKSSNKNITKDNSDIKYD